MVKREKKRQCNASHIVLQQTEIATSIFLIIIYEQIPESGFWLDRQKKIKLKIKLYTASKK